MNELNTREELVKCLNARLSCEQTEVKTRLNRASETVSWLPFKNVCVMGFVTCLFNIHHYNV